MSDSTGSEISAVFREFRQGDQAALDRLWPLIYDELRRLARGFLRKERKGHSLQSSGLVHEAYLRLIGQRDTNWKDRAHFHAVAAMVMRRLLVDHARHRHAEKRGDGLECVSLDDQLIGEDRRDIDVVDIDQALQRLDELSPRQARIVELRVFGGLSEREVAEVLDISRSTATREWRAARAWLITELRR